MNEIRRIKESEAEDFLRVLCDVFTLDFERAYPLFFEDPLFDLNRKWGYFEGGELHSVLTTTPLQFGWGNAVGIAGVATREYRRGEGIARKLLEKVIRASERDGEASVLLFAQDSRLYDGLGFEAIDQVVRAPVVTLPVEIPLERATIESVRDRYRSWSEASPNRLRRSESRWQYWEWAKRDFYKLEDGYFTLENGMIREVVCSSVPKRMPVPRGTEWFGLSKVTDDTGVAVVNPASTLILMGLNTPDIPELFMTDQF